VSLDHVHEGEDGWASLRKVDHGPGSAVPPRLDRVVRPPRT
jgi:hypothetical protein